MLAVIRSQSSKGGDLSKKGRSSGKSRYIVALYRLNLRSLASTVFRDNLVAILCRPPSRGVDLLRMSPTRRFFASLLRSGGDWSSEASVDVDGDVGRYGGCDINLHDKGHHDFL